MDASILLGYQRRWIADTSPVKIIEKSRRIGLSYAEAADAVLHAMASDGANVYYISFNKDMTEGFIADCATWAKSFGEGAKVIDEEVFPDPAKPDRAILKFSIAFASGNQIQAFSSNPRNLRSKGRPKERLIIDEAAFVDDLDELLKAALAMTMWGGQVHIISTHNGDDNPFNTLIQDVRAGRYDYGLHRVTLDDALNDGLYQRICNVSGQAWTAENEAAWRESLVKRYRPNEDEELFCIPAQGGGAYLPRMLIEACMEPGEVLRYNGSRAFNEATEPTRRADMEEWILENLPHLLSGLDQTRRHVLGMDFARSGDLTVIAPMMIGEDLRRVVPWLVELRNVPHKQQEQVLFAVADNLPRLSAGAIDAGGNGSYLAEAAVDRYGSLVEGLKFSEGWYRDNMPKYKAAFEDRLITLPRNDDVLEDHRAIKMIRGVARVPEGKTDKAKERHGDSAIACALAYYASLNPAAPIEFQAAPGRHDRRADKDPWDDEGDRQDFKEKGTW